MNVVLTLAVFIIVFLFSKVCKLAAEIEDLKHDNRIYKGRIDALKDEMKYYLKNDRRI
nr:MAG TPA: cell division protein [Caudoviricetes sp.]